MNTSTSPKTVIDWMSWEGGVDLAAFTQPGLPMPNVIVHVARLVATPVGSAPAGMLFWQPDPAAAPVAMGFVSPDAAVAAYFGPHIFKGTPFEGAPAVMADIRICHDTPDTVSARLEAAGHVFEVSFRGLGASCAHDREPGGMTPFTQHVVEAVPASVELKVDGKVIPLILPPVGLSGGAPAVWSPVGQYTR